MKTLLLATTLLLASAPSLVANDDHEAWVADFDQAVVLATEQGKDLFVDFTGSDWCGWCKKLNKEVFSHEEFLVPAQEAFVLVALDFPHGEEVMARVPDPERNEELSQIYGISGFPTCLLMTPEGEVFGRMGYQEGGPEQYIEDMLGARTEGKRQLAELAELSQALADAEDVAPVLEKAVALLEEMDGDSPGVTTVAGMAHQAMAHDPDNASGLRRRSLLALLGAGQVYDTLFTDALALDGENADGLLEQVALAMFRLVRDDTSALAAVQAAEKLAALETLHDEAMVASLLSQGALWCENELDDHERALGLAHSALGWRDELPPELVEMLEKIIG